MGEGALSFRETLAAVPGLDFEETAPGEMTVTGNGKKFRLGELSSGVPAGLDMLFSGNHTQQEMDQQVTNEGGLNGSMQFGFLLEQFRQMGLLSRCIMLGESTLLRILPCGRGAGGQTIPVVNDRQRDYRLSRFTLLRSDDGCLVVESPLAHNRLQVADKSMAGWISSLAIGGSVNSLLHRLPELGDTEAESLLALLVKEQFVEDPDAASSPQLDGWEVHDLYFHARSRLGRGGNAYGGTYRFAGKTEPLPLLKPLDQDNDRVIPLSIPDLDRLAREDPPFTAVLENRRSLRVHGESPITVRQLGEFLYRVGRERGVGSQDKSETGSRPYPTGGALYELEFYLVVDRCEGLDAGLYHYRPLDHALTEIAPAAPALQAMTGAAAASMRSEIAPQMVIVMTARFGRANWKYQSLAYALVLKDVGVAMQTMYLVATAMDLAPCALGGGDSDLFAHASGIDYFTEGAVGEFALGSRS
jgi:SagB-type dehydrogenase family enzyme